MRYVLTLVLCLFSKAVVAAPSLSGLWWNPAESGWGLTVEHQPRFAFVTFYVYGGDGKPTWFFGQLDATDATGTNLAGPLFAATGTSYSRLPFSASETRPEQIGSGTFVAIDANHATLTYTIGTTRYEKTVERLALKPVAITGTFEGLATLSVFGTDSTDFVITNAADASVHISRAAFFSGTCQFTGRPTQFGVRIAVSGTYRCSDFSEGTWTTSDLSIYDDQYLGATIVKRATASGQTSTERWIGLKR